MTAHPLCALEPEQLKDIYGGMQGLPDSGYTGLFYKLNALADLIYRILQTAPESSYAYGKVGYTQ